MNVIEKAKHAVQIIKDEPFPSCDEEEMAYIISELLAIVEAQEIKPEPEHSDCWCPKDSVYFYDQVVMGICMECGLIVPPITEENK